MSQHNNNNNNTKRHLLSLLGGGAWLMRPVHAPAGNPAAGEDWRCAASL